MSWNIDSQARNRRYCTSFPLIPI
uniref:Uncharacterized protein n=1 Tax=Talaromyces marneffei PM1 TaxID=1077442 RepID=A0A093UTT7_TALMA